MELKSFLGGSIRLIKFKFLFESAFNWSETIPAPFFFPPHLFSAIGGRPAGFIVLK